MRSLTKSPKAPALHSCFFSIHGVDEMARKKSSFYHTRWNLVGINETVAAQVLGVTIEDVKRFDIEGAPIAERLLLLWDRKHVGYEGWNGWLFSRGILIHKKQRFTPQTILNDRAFRQSLEADTSKLIRSLSPR